jgi:hypothetical protein
MNLLTKTFLFRPVKDSSLFNKIQEAVVTPKSNKSYLKIYPHDVTQIGKHYLFSVLSNNGVPFTSKSRIVKRHYTITNSLRKPVYDALLDCIRTG